MNDMELQRLIDAYLDGESAPEDVERLDATVRESPAALRELLASAAMEMRLRQALSGQAPGERRRRAEPAAAWRKSALLRRILTVVVIVAAAAGWAAAGLSARQSYARQGQLNEVQHELADLKTAVAAGGGEASLGKIAEPQIVDTRGLVLVVPENEDFDQAVRVRAGAVVPPSRKVWTCPWGGAGSRFPDGTRVSLDRSTVARFREEGDGRRIELASGIVSVTHRPAGLCGTMVLAARKGSVSFQDAEVTLAVLGDQTIVEVAHGEAEVRRASDGRTVKVAAGQYAVIGEDDGLAAVTGQLRWRVEPVKRPASQVGVQ